MQLFWLHKRKLVLTIEIHKIISYKDWKKSPRKSFGNHLQVSDWGWYNMFPIILLYVNINTYPIIQFFIHVQHIPLHWPELRLRLGLGSFGFSNQILETWSTFTNHSQFTRLQSWEGAAGHSCFYCAAATELFSVRKFVMFL